MNETFNLDRFCQYFVYEVKGCLKKFGLAAIAAIAAGFLPIFFCLYLQGWTEGAYSAGSYYENMNVDPMWHVMQSIFWVGLFLVPVLCASFTFEDLSTKPKRISALMVPASQLEKFLTRWLIFVPLSMIAFLLCYELLDLLRCLLTILKYPDSHIVQPVVADPTLHLWRDIFGSIFFQVVVMLQGIFVLGSILWPRLSALKTTAALFVIWNVNAIWCAVLTSSLVSRGWGFYGIEIDEPVDSILFTKCILWCIALVCTVLAYFRYKEIETIQRW